MRAPKFNSWEILSQESTDEVAILFVQLLRYLLKITPRQHSTSGVEGKMQLDHRVAAMLRLELKKLLI
jgi:hypothetical protein